MAYDEHLEQEALSDVVTRLTARFTGTHSPEQVESAVMSSYGSFKDSTVRDFIPVLVEHASKERLTTMAE
jgi:hypothetical protein